MTLSGHRYEGGTLRRLVLSLLFLLLLLPATAQAQQSRYDGTRWIRLWEKRDASLSESTRIAAATHRVSESWLRSCNGSEGGNVSVRKLRVSLVRGWGPGWNLAGSYAFGPWQYMLGDRPPDGPHEWGTFGAYDDAAFWATRARGVNVPFRFKRPDSNVGQALVTAYMFSRGLSSHWVGAGC
jgi:hypothetical protein